MKSVRSTARTTQAGTAFPHSWDLSRWPSDIWPSDTQRARWLVRAYRDELVSYGALARAGRTLVVIGRGYSAWLEQRAAHVPGYVSNNPRMRVA
jgi:hypothetical protein